MTTLREPGDAPREDEQELSGSNFLRKEMENANIDVDKPLDQWSKEERMAFGFLLNNFYSKIPGGMATNKAFQELLKPGSLDRPTKEKYDPKDLTQQASGPLRWQFSEKYLNGSERQLQENIKQASEIQKTDGMTTTTPNNDEFRTREK